MKEKFAAISGASSGLGKSFAQQLAKQGHNLLLISLPNENLSTLCYELELQYNIKAICYETDLSIKENVWRLTDWINKKYSINILINNAGVGGTKKIEEVSTDYVERIIRVNVLATTILIHRLLPNLKENNEAYILNVSSLAAFSPMGYKTVYPASKSFIYSFSRGLYQELKETNVHVGVVSPGPMKTNGEITRRIEKQGFFGRLTSRKPDDVAAYCLKQLRRKKPVIRVNLLSLIVLHVLPTWITLPILSNKMKGELNVE